LTSLITAWLGELAPQDRRMLELRAAGYTLEETADELGVSLTSVFHNCRRLGIALAEHAGIHIELRPHKLRHAEEQPASTRRALSVATASATRTGGLRKASHTRRSSVAPCAA